MALHYPTQRKIEALKLTSGYHGSNRLSDMRKATFGGRGGQTDELNFLRINPDPGPTVDIKLSDIWVSFGAGWIADTSKRADQLRRVSYESGSLS